METVQKNMLWKVWLSWSVGNPFKLRMKKKNTGLLKRVKPEEVASSTSSTSLRPTWEVSSTSLQAPQYSSYTFSSWYSFWFSVCFVFWPVLAAPQPPLSGWLWTPSRRLAPVYHTNTKYKIQIPIQIQIQIHLCIIHINQKHAYCESCTIIWSKYIFRNRVNEFLVVYFDPPAA